MGSQQSNFYTKLVWIDGKIIFENWFLSIQFIELMRRGFNAKNSSKSVKLWFKISFNWIFSFKKWVGLPIGPLAQNTSILQPQPFLNIIECERHQKTFKLKVYQSFISFCQYFSFHSASGINSNTKRTEKKVFCIEDLMEGFPFFQFLKFH